MPELERLEDGTPVYEPDGKVLEQFYLDRSEVCAIVGPIGSGTSTAACHRIMQTAFEQQPSTWDGKRKIRAVVVRPTYPELETSTVQTWLFWFPEERFGRFLRRRPMCHFIKVGDVEAEVWFLALDGDDDIKKLRSTEWTIGWMNELEFQTYEIFSELHSRCHQGRYPSMAEGGPTWRGVIADMNAPREDHFLARMAGWAEWPDDVPEEKRIQWPAEWKLLVQPPGLIEVFGPDGKTVAGYENNPKAENTKWLKGDYKSLALGHDKRWIDARIMNRVSFLMSGDPVWIGVNPDVHFAQHDLTYVPGLRVTCALDFGRRPTALIGQEVGDRLHLQCEFRMYGCGASIFAPKLKRFLEQNYRSAVIQFTGDPQGTQRNQVSDENAYEIFESYGMRVIPARGRSRQINDVDERVEAVQHAITTHRFLVGTRCPTLRAALSGKYVLDKIDGADPMPMKRGDGAKYSDIADCLQYMCLFLGEGRRLLNLTPAASEVKPVKVGGLQRNMRRVMA